MAKKPIKQYITVEDFRDTYGADETLLFIPDDNVINFYAQQAATRIDNKAISGWDNNIPNDKLELFKEANLRLVEHWIRKGNDLSKAADSGSFGQISWTHNPAFVEEVPVIVVDLLYRSGAWINRANLKIAVEVPVELGAQFKTEEFVNTFSITKLDVPLPGNMNLVTEAAINQKISDIVAGNINFATGEPVSIISLLGNENTLYKKDVIDASLNIIQGDLDDRPTFTEVEDTYYNKTEVDDIQSGNNSRLDNQQAAITSLNVLKVSKNHTLGDETSTIDRTSTFTSPFIRKRNLVGGSQLTVLTDGIYLNLTDTNNILVPFTPTDPNHAINKIYSDNITNNLQFQVDNLSSQLQNLAGLIDENFTEKTNFIIGTGTYPFVINEAVLIPFDFPTYDGESFDVNGNVITLINDATELIILIQIVVNNTTISKSFDIVRNGTIIVKTIVFPEQTGTYIIEVVERDLSVGDYTYDFRLQSGAGTGTINIAPLYKFNYQVEGTGSGGVFKSSETQDDYLGNELVGINPWRTDINTNTGGILTNANAIGVNTTNISNNAGEINNIKEAFDNTNKDLGLGLYGFDSLGNPIILNLASNPGFQVGETENSNFGRKLIEVGDPIELQDAATKNYVDTTITSKVDKTTTYFDDPDTYLIEEGIVDNFVLTKRVTKFINQNGTVPAVGDQRTSLTLDGTLQKAITELYTGSIWLSTGVDDADLDQIVTNQSIGNIYLNKVENQFGDLTTIFSQDDDDGPSMRSQLTDNSNEKTKFKVGLHDIFIENTDDTGTDLEYIPITDNSIPNKKYVDQVFNQLGVVGSTMANVYNSNPEWFIERLIGSENVVYSLSTTLSPLILFTAKKLNDSTSQGETYWGPNSLQIGEFDPLFETDSPFIIFAVPNPSFTGLNKNKKNENNR